MLETDDETASVELVEAQLLEAMGRVRTKEIERGVCLVGPHRDDLVLALGGLPAKGYASHGESWSFALALRLASYELLTHGDDGADGGAAVLRAGRRAGADPRRRVRGARRAAARPARGAGGRGAGRSSSPRPSPTTCPNRWPAHAST